MIYLDKEREKEEVSSIWAVHWGRYGNEGFVIFASKTKKKAVNRIKEEGGFKYIKEYDYYENDDKQEWYRIEKMDYLI